MGDDIIMSASDDETVAFTDLSTGIPVARIGTGFCMTCATITQHGRLTCFGPNSGAAILSPQEDIFVTVEGHVWPASLQELRAASSSARGLGSVTNDKLF